MRGSDFCSAECAEAAKVREAIKRQHVVGRKHRGAYSEIIACAWLLESGYEVFRNMSSHGPIDIVAMKGRETLYIDVKTLTMEMMTKKGRVGEGNGRGGQLRPEQKAAGVIPLYVSPDGICSFDREKIENAYTAVYKSLLT
jgi:hypothetical protein